MIIPQFTIRRLLAIITACSVVFLVLARAVSGDTWAIGVSASVGTLVLIMFVNAGLFATVWVCQQAGSRLRKTPGEASPFASDRAAPQILPPEDV